MTQHMKSVVKQATALALAALLSLTSIPSVFAAEPLINLQPVASEEAPAPESPKEEPIQEGEDSSSSTSDSSSEKPPSILPEEPGIDEPGLDSGETLPSMEEPPLIEEPMMETSGLDPPDRLSFEASKESTSLFQRKSSDSTTIYMEKIPDISHTYPFSGGSPYFGYLFYTTGGDTAYCVEPARFNSTNGSVVTGSKTYSSLSQTQQDEIARAIAANPGGHSNPYQYMACQAIIWEIAYNQAARSGSVYKAVITANSDKLSSYYEDIRSEMASLGDIPSFMNPDPQNPTEHSMTENDGEWNIHLENTNPSVTLRAEDFETRAPFSFSVSGDTLAVTSPTQPGSDSYTAWHGGSGNGALIFWNSSQQTKATFDETAGIPANGYMTLSSDWVQVDPPPDEGKEGRVGYLQINKYDGETNLPLGGAIFKIESETYINESFTIPYGGATVVIPIPEGKDSIEVTITEVTAPHLYVLDSTPKTVTVAAGDQVNIAQVAFDNYPMDCSLTIYKHEKGNEGIALQGARFRIRYADPDVSAQVWTKTTDVSGRIHIDLPYSGTLIIEELEAPSGYVIGSISTHEVVVEKGEDKEISISNDKMAQIIVTKKDNQSGQLLQGAIIKATLLRSHTEPYESGMVYTRTTGPDGVAIFDNMIPGEYRVEETSPPQYYLPTDVVHTVNVYDGSHEPMELEFRNNPWTGLTIKKLDTTDGHGLQGAVFKVYEGTSTEATKFLGDFISDENGTVVIQELESNKYYTVQEAQPPYGYFLDREDNPQTILIKPEAINENITVIFRNMPKPKLLIQKIDADTGAPLAGAVFRVSRRSTAEYVDVTTGPDGTYLLENMEEDWYEVYELRAPTNYVTDDTHYDIELIAGETAELVVKNRKKPTFTIEKIDSVTLQPLEGVVFEISIKNGKSLGQFTTNTEGKIILEDLDPGEIYLAKEVQALPGYLLDETVHELRLDENESSILKLKNTPENPLIISKRDAVTGEPIPDVGFYIEEVGGRTIGTYYTDDAGIINLPDQEEIWVQVTEIKPTDGYKPDLTPRTLKLESGKLNILEFRNQPYPALQIIKLDADTRQPMEGIKIRIYDKFYREVGTYTTYRSPLRFIPIKPNILPCRL